jgi:predicted nuclease of restriction endonuclease-like (RecB) superfamily
VINTAKRLYYNGLITNSKNKIKTTWNIVKSITGKNLVNKLPLSVCINGALTENQQVIADSFQIHFLSIADKLVSNNIEDINDINCKDYLYRIFKNPCPNLIFDRTTIKEIENIIKSLKSKNSC